LPPLGDGMTYLVQSEGQGAHPVDAQSVDRIRRQRQRQKLVGLAETTFSHVKEGDTGFKSDGLRDFFLYRDLGIAKATGGKVVATLVRANKPPEEGTGWHRHIADFHIVIMLKGWARFMYEDQLTLVEAGDCVHQQPGIVHYLFDYSKDMEYLEVAGPANFGTVEMPAPCEVPAVTPWT
jgi:quercetin dioxygenase-like cupin family protein